LAQKKMPSKKHTGLEEYFMMKLIEGGFEDASRLRHHPVPAAIVANTESGHD
jgi:hypothetical protein